MREPTVDLVARVAAGVLADGAFMLTEPVDTPSVPGEGLVFTIPYTGSQNGQLSFEAPLELGFEMMDNLADDTADLQLGALDAMRELTNVIAGALMPEIFGEEAVELGLPAGPGEPVADGDAKVRAELITDGGHRLAVTFAWGAKS